MKENLSVSPQMLVEICGGFLTWMGLVTFTMPLIWWATESIRFADINVRAFFVGGIGAPITYLITGLIEHRRNA